MIIAERKATHPGNTVLFTMNSKPMEIAIRPSHDNLEDVVEFGDRVGAANQQAAPNHWTDAQQHYFKLIDSGFESLGHDAILATSACNTILSLNLPRFFSLSTQPAAISEGGELTN